MQEYNQQVVLINDPHYSGIKLAIGRIEINETDPEHYIFHTLSDKCSDETLAYKNLRGLFAE